MSAKPASSKSVSLLYCVFSWLLAILAFVLVLILAVPIGFYGMAMYLAPTLPSVSQITTAHLEMPLQIYSSDNKLVGQYGNRLSLPVTPEQVPKGLIDAFLAAEDASFYEHSGISIKGLGRAVTEIITEDNGQQTGGSTITMQVAKNYFLSSERTFRRKLTELYLARRIEDELGKDEILTLYFNKIYMGEGAYGVKAGAKKYFSKSLENLTIAEMATLAGLPKAPSQNNPVSNPEKSLARRNWIIGRMLALGYITQAEHDDAVNAPLGVHLYQEKLDVDMPYLAEMTRHTLTSRYGDAVIDAGWRVKLTVNSEAQIAAEEAVRKGLMSYDTRHGWRGVEAHDEPLENFSVYAGMQPAKVVDVEGRTFEAVLKNGQTVTVPWSGMRWAKEYISADRYRGFPSRASDIVKTDDIVRVVQNDDDDGWRLAQLPKVQGSLVSLKPDDGALVALIGGFDYRYSKFNRAIQGGRQPGSTVKPLIYSTALEKGYTPDSIVADSPLRVGDWTPQNSDGRFYGNITLRRGLYLSRNLVSIRVLQAAGISDARQLLGQFGLDKDKQPTTLSLALGSGDVSPLQMATAYATFANGGHRIQPYFIDQIFDYQGNELYAAQTQQACAKCFNETLEETNATLLTAYEESLDTPLQEREEQLQQLQDNPQIVALVRHSTSEQIQALLATDNTVDTDSAESEDDTSETNSTIATGKALSEEEKETLRHIQQTLDMLKYDAGPQSDRLPPTLRQYSRATQAPRIISATTAYNMASILRDVIQRGTGRRALALGRDDIGGKTGTTNEMKDAWFAGFQPTLVTIVWVGFDQPSTLGRGEYGGVAALPIWIDYMGKVLESVPKRWVTQENRSETDKEEQDVIDLSDGDSDDDKTTIADKDTSSKISNRRIAQQNTTEPPTASVTERVPPEPEEEEKEEEDTAVQNALETPAEQ